jgi:hypothetical protein
MISLLVDGKERVCLAQISNTLLKKYSYNEIHNRRVALGINCIQCTPVQLEILRNTGAMPISSRRCGMITKKEAERLVKSFLDESKPPTLPENFSFRVEHKCEYGCVGVFFPSRYNSSRAKCVQCTHCRVFYSPNKFIFHSHQTHSEQKKYAQSNATINFNSWRKHIFLVNESNDEQLSSAWEDVKSIFNSGKRKRCQMTMMSRKRYDHGYDMYANNGEGEEDEEEDEEDEEEEEADEEGVITRVSSVDGDEINLGEQNLSSNSSSSSSFYSRDYGEMGVANSLYLNLMTNILNPFYSSSLMASMKSHDNSRHLIQRLGGANLSTKMTEPAAVVAAAADSSSYRNREFSIESIISDSIGGIGRKKEKTDEQERDSFMEQQLKTGDKSKSFMSIQSMID